MQQTISDDWQRAFRQSDATKVVQIVCDAWQELSQCSGLTFHARAREHAVTELLCEYIRKTRSGLGLTGLWGYEDRLGTVVSAPGGGLQVAGRRRTDIQYFSDRTSPSLRLVFEFKKIDRTKTRRDAYTGAEGMARFVTGDYSLGQPVAVMVGMLLDDPTSCVPPLKKWLASPDAQAALTMVPFPNGDFMLAPTRFDAAEFETQHVRPVGKAPPHGRIFIAHLFLSF